MPDGLSLRAARLDDIDALDRLFKRSYARLLAPDYPPSVLVTAIPAIGRAQPELVNTGLFYVIEDTQGALLGAGGWSLRAPGGRPVQRGVGHIRHVATDPDATRRGVGRRLLEHIALVARGSGMASLHCQSTLTGRAFYEAMGFDVQAETMVPLRGGIEFPALLMTRLL
jgi:GNAT superfamily N-acetyltransferase